MKCGVKFPLLAKCILRHYFMVGRTFNDLQITEIQMGGLRMAGLRMAGLRMAGLWMAAP
jgi:hypothetical protein